MKQKNRWIPLSLALSLALPLAACGQPEEPAPTPAPTAAEEPAVSAPEASQSAAETKPTPGPEDDSACLMPGEDSLKQLRLEMEPSAAIAGIIYLGWFEGEPFTDAFYASEEFQTALEQYPFLREIRSIAEGEGGELYCIVPADPKATVEVTEWTELEENNYEPKAGAVLYQSDGGEPFFIRGNVSDIIPNLSVSITDSFGNTLHQYHPYISLRDGSVGLPTEEDQPVVLDLMPRAEFWADYHSCVIETPEYQITFDAAMMEDRTVRIRDFMEFEEDIERQYTPYEEKLVTVVTVAPESYVTVSDSDQEYGSSSWAQDGTIDGDDCYTVIYAGDITGLTEGPVEYSVLPGGFRYLDTESGTYLILVGD